MTEAQWLGTSSAVTQMARLAMQRGSGRKLQLLGCAVLHLVRDESFDPSLTLAIATVEAYASGELDDAVFRTTAKAVDLSRRADGSGSNDVWDYRAPDAVANLFATDLRRGITAILAWVRLVTRLSDIYGDTRGRYQAVRATVCDLVREIFGNPFRPWQQVADWLEPAARIAPDGSTVRVSETAVRVAEGIDHDRAYDRLPILADALEEAGWNDAELLAHCRTGSGHVRGCWVVDLVLGRR